MPNISTPQNSSYRPENSKPENSKPEKYKAANYRTEKEKSFDVIVIGAGVVGCAMARRFTLKGLRVGVVEKAPDILYGASKGNSALLHTGFDAPVGSIESKCIRQGYHEYMELQGRFGLPVLKSGAMVIAWSGEQLKKLPEIVHNAHQNGDGDVHEISADEVYRREPNLGPGVMGGVLVPGEGIIDPWNSPLAYIRQAVLNGAQAYFETEVKGGNFDGALWELRTNRGPVKGAYVINCAGLYGDIVETIARQSPFKITPRKGQFVVYDKPAYELVKAVILPVPTEKTKGVVITRTIYGNLLVGPTAEDQEDREDASVEEKTLQALMRRGETILPKLKGQSVNAVYAGLRPATQFKDFQIEALGDKNWISVGGIRSTGLTAALGVATYVDGLFDKTFGSEQTLPQKAFENSQVVWPDPLPNLAEHLPRAYQQAECGEIVCHCELVTRKEIRDALTGPLAARSLEGLKRRTRVMMGRCQGFFCSWRVAELSEGKIVDTLGDPIKAIDKTSRNETAAEKETENTS